MPGGVGLALWAAICTLMVVVAAASALWLIPVVVVPLAATYALLKLSGPSRKALPWENDNDGSGRPKRSRNG